MYTSSAWVHFSAAETRHLYMYFRSETMHWPQACKLLVVPRGHQFCCRPTWSRTTGFDRFPSHSYCGVNPYLVARHAPVCGPVQHARAPIRFAGDPQFAGPRAAFPAPPGALCHLGTCALSLPREVNPRGILRISSRRRWTRVEEAGWHVAQETHCIYRAGLLLFLEVLAGLHR